MVGQRVEVLVDGPNPRDAQQFMGRSSCFRPTVLDGGAPFEAGDMVTAEVHGATTHTLFARPDQVQAVA